MHVTCKFKHNCVDKDFLLNLTMIFNFSIKDKQVKIRDKAKFSN